MSKLNIIKYICLFFIIVYIFYPSKEEKIKKNISNKQTIISNILTNENILYEDLATLKTSWFIDIENNIISLATPFDKSDKIISNLTSLLNSINNISCIKYNKQSFPISNLAKNILEENKDYFLTLIWSWNNIDLTNKYWITWNILLTSNNTPKIISNIEAEKYFWKIDENDFPKYYLSRIPYKAWNWTFFWYKFKIYSYSLVKFNNINYKNDTWDSKNWNKLIFTISKSKKNWNGLIINKFNNKQLADLTKLLKKSNITLDEINIDNENLYSKIETYWAQWYYENIDSYIKKLKEVSVKNKKEFDIIKISDYKYIYETNEEYIWIIFDNDNILENSKPDIKEKLSLSKKSYNISNTIYFIDKDLFKKYDTNLINKDNCTFWIKNWAVILLK